MWEEEACSHALWWMAHCTVRNDGTRGIRGSSWMGGGLDGRYKFFLMKAGINSIVQCGSPTGPRRCEEIMYAHIASMLPHPPPWQTMREMDGQSKYVHTRDPPQHKRHRRLRVCVRVCVKWVHSDMQAGRSACF